MQQRFPHEIKHLDEITLCKTCTTVVVQFFIRHEYDFTQDQSILLSFEPHTDDKISCECCGKEDESEYFILSVPEEIQFSVADTLSKDIGGCEFCEGDQRARLVNTYNNDPFDKESRMDYEDIRGDSAELYVGEKNVPDELNTLFVSLIVCKCGYGRDSWHPKHNPDSGVFEPLDDIYTKRDVGKFWGFDFKEFSEFGERYGEKITQEDLHKFREHLIAYPMLALKHKTGQTIYRALEKHFEANDYATLKQGETKLYRGRTRKKDAPPLTEEKLWAPPRGMPQHGRYNTVGVPVLYVSDKLDAIPYEINPSNEDVIDLAEIEIKTDQLSIFDLDSFDFEFQGFFSEKNEESNPLKFVYLLPNFIGTCCSYIGYKGVKYRGVHQSNSNDDYMNYALFNVLRNIDLAIVSVKAFVPEISYKLNETASDPSDDVLPFPAEDIAF